MVNTESIANELCNKFMRTSGINPDARRVIPVAKPLYGCRYDSTYHFDNPIGRLSVRR